MRRYLQRWAQVDSGFRINVPSHALTIDTELSDERRAKASEAGPESSVVLVKVTGVNAPATVEAGDGDRTRLRLVKQLTMED